MDAKAGDGRYYYIWTRLSCSSQPHNVITTSFFVSGSAALRHCLSANIPRLSWMMIIAAFKTPTTSFCIRLQVTTGYLDDEGLYLGWYYQLGGGKLRDPTVSGNVSCVVLCSVIVQLNCCSGNTEIGFWRLLVFTH